jgi:hypothetical protein
VREVLPEGSGQLVFVVLQGGGQEFVPLDPRQEFVVRPGLVEVEIVTVFGGVRLAMRDTPALVIVGESRVWF